jgi:hypothetical protein
MIEDDGLTFSSRPMRLGFAWNDAGRTLTIALEPGSRLRAPRRRTLRVQASGSDVVQTVEFRGGPVELKL